MVYLASESTIMTKSKQNIADEFLRIEEDSTHTAKAHFNMASGWKFLHYALGVPSAVLAALSGVSVLNDHDDAALYLAAAAALLSALLTFLNPNEHANTHQRAGNQHNTLKNRARVAAQVNAEVESLADLMKTLESIARDQSSFTENSPGISRWAFKKARSGINSGEASYSVDAEDGSS